MLPGDRFLILGGLSANIGYMKRSLMFDSKSDVVRELPDLTVPDSFQFNHCFNKNGEIGIVG